jgi:hypothetical protein
MEKAESRLMDSKDRKSLISCSDTLDSAMTGSDSIGKN